MVVIIDNSTNIYFHYIKQLYFPEALIQISFRVKLEGWYRIWNVCFEKNKVVDKIDKKIICFHKV